MKEWVIDYLKKKDKFLPAEWLNEIERRNFDLRERQEHRKQYLNVATYLIDGLRCNFRRAEDRKGKEVSKSCEDFTFILCSVLGDLKKECFDKLCSLKNTFFVYGPKPAYTKGYRLDNSIDLEDDLKIVVFEHEVASLDWFIARGIIVHELIHIILGRGASDSLVNLRAEQWGFGKEMEAFLEWYKERYG
jgi:hypothetical protein